MEFDEESIEFLNKLIEICKNDNNNSTIHEEDEDEDYENIEENQIYKLEDKEINNININNVLEYVFKIIRKRNNNQVSEFGIISSRETTLTLVTIVCNLLKCQIEPFVKDDSCKVLDDLYDTILFMLKELLASSTTSSTSSSSLSISSPQPTLQQQQNTDSADDSITSTSPPQHIVSPIINKIKKSGGRHHIRLSTNNTQSNNPRQQLYNIISVTLLGTLCLLFPSNEKLLIRSIPYLFEIGLYKSQTQSLIISTISSEIINRPKILSNYVLQFINFSKDNSNVFSIIANLYQYNNIDFENNIKVLVQCFKEPENKIGILSILSEIAKQSPLVLIPYVSDLKSSLNQISTASQFTIILRSLAQKYSYSISPIVDDIMKLLDNVSGSGNGSVDNSDNALLTSYSLPEILGMCGADKTLDAFNYLYSLLKRQQEKTTTTTIDDNNIVVSTLKGLKSIQKTSPNLINMNDPLFQKYMSTSGRNSNELISSFTNSLVDDLITGQNNNNNNNKTTTTTTTTTQENEEKSNFEILDEKLKSISIEYKSNNGNGDINILEFNNYLSSNNKFTLLSFDILLSLVVIPSKTSIVVDDDNEPMVVFTFINGDRKSDLSIQLVNENQDKINNWIKINFLQSIVNLPTFINNQQLSEIYKLLNKQSSEGESSSTSTTTTTITSFESNYYKIINNPFLNSKSIIELNQDTKNISRELTKRSIGVVNVASPIGSNNITNSSTIGDDSNGSGGSGNGGLVKVPSSINGDAGNSSLPTSITNTSLSSLSNHYQGSLIKKSKYLGRKTNLYCSLSDHALFGFSKKYDEPENQATNKCVIKIQFKDIIEILHTKKKENSFLVVTEKRKYLFTASSQIEKTEWVQQLETAIKNSNSINNGNNIQSSDEDDVLSNSSSTITSPSPSSPTLKSEQGKSTHKRLKFSFSQYINFKKKQ